MVASRWACRTTTFSIRATPTIWAWCRGHGAGCLYQRDGRRDAGHHLVAAVKYDLFNETLNLTMIDGQNPFAEGKTQLQLIRCPDY